jgi:bifunctional non-homologous end joining protein LigD
VPRAAPTSVARVLAKLKDLPKRPPGFVEPMKALLVDQLPRGEDWTYELKFDGYRALAIKRAGRWQLLSRNAKNLTARFPQIADALPKLPCREAMLDAEIVAVDEQGKSSFQLLQAYPSATGRKPPLLAYVFDLLNLDGRDLTGLPLVERKELLRPLLAAAPDQIRFSTNLTGDIDSFIKEMKARGLEGIIAKRRDSKYEAGRRGGAWVKFKWSNEQEFVIGGYTEPRGSRAGFGALLVGYYDENNARLLFASKVGTGFNQRSLTSLYERFQKIRRTDCPFANLPEKRQGRYGLGLTASEMKSCYWLEPKMVGQIRFTEWTRDGHLRHPVFLGLREDKDPGEVHREAPI